jgi:hypothetical protein
MVRATGCRSACSEERAINTLAPFSGLTADSA